MHEQWSGPRGHSTFYLMRLYHLSFTVTFALIILCASARLVELTEENFDSNTKEGKWLLELYLLTLVLGFASYIRFFPI